ncbi:MAG TPA: putative Fe-S cluster assembly protein SufT [Elusimicrobiota bacterium]|nr:putative Fe-S cluster assembly protein SufT [Elusimicrobiota bacterium]
MTISAPTKLTRDCEVVQIPDGYRVRLARGTEVRLLQALGDSFTVMTEYHTMVRIDGKDADAIGQTVAPQQQPPTTPADAGPLNPEELRDRVWYSLRGVYDPEIPVNVVDLGLIYKCELQPLPDGGFRADIVMTLTAPGCGMGNVLKDDAERRVQAVPGIREAHVELVVDPPWDQSMMSEAARLELGL